MKQFFLIIYLLSCSLPLSAEEVKCEKFDIKCKTSKWIKETKEFQKKGFEDAQKQLKGNK
mgnify:CR=1 FL=1|jgi:hypothetical protein|tara:strand:+ start:229 stop:408 length:180 start_codon:yes stop_codon:yes gene_type:complete